ncbi:MAG: hypothetical protein ACYS71_05390, partial [Planctomycetota bacterium]
RFQAPQATQKSSLLNNYELRTNNNEPFNQLYTLTCRPNPQFCLFPFYFSNRPTDQFGSIMQNKANLPGAKNERNYCLHKGL